MDYRYCAKLEVGSLTATVSPPAGHGPLWGRGLTQAIEVELPAFNSQSITEVYMQILRGDNDFIVYQTAALAPNANYNLIVERYLRPTDKIRFVADSGEETATSLIYFRVLMREE